MTVGTLKPITSTTPGHITAASKINRTKSNRKSSKFLIITPVVSIDRNYNNDNAGNRNSAYCIDDADNENELNHDNDEFNCVQQSIANNNVQRTSTTTTNLLPKRSAASWRWCTLFCSAIKCFGNNSNAFSTRNTTRAYATATALPTILQRYQQKEHDTNQNVIYEL